MQHAIRHPESNKGSARAFMTIQHYPNVISEDSITTIELLSGDVKVERIGETVFIEYIPQVHEDTPFDTRHVTMMSSLADICLLQCVELEQSESGALLTKRVLGIQIHFQAGMSFFIPAIDLNDYTAKYLQKDVVYSLQAKQLAIDEMLLEAENSNQRLYVVLQKLLKGYARQSAVSHAITL